MIRLLLARHGETKLNSVKRFQGQSNAGLNPRGIQQANALAQMLADRELYAIYCSDQKRAWQTADRIAAFHSGLAVIKEQRLREIDFGLWEGLTTEEVQTKFPMDWAAWQKDPQSAPTGGEAFTTAMKRTGQLLEIIRTQFPNQTILIVAHAGVLQALICQVMEILPRLYPAFHLYTASLSELWLYDRGATLVFLNDLGGLERAGIPPESVSGR